MLRQPVRAAATICLAAFAACGITEVTSEELAPVVQRDAIPFVGPSAPVEVLDRLAANQLVIIGETHFLQEHRAFLAALVRDLHARGFRQLLMELPHMADWLLRDHARNGQLLPDWVPPASLVGGLIEPVREFNRTLPPDQQFDLRAIDVNLDDYGGAGAFHDLLRVLAGHLENPGPVQDFLARPYNTAPAQTASLTTLQSALTARRNELTASWGVERYETVAELVEVELASVRIRDIREDDYDRSVKLRENEMKRLSDLRLAGSPFRSLLNVGGNHAQKSRFKGTEQQWLGDYLVHQSTAVGGAVIVISVGAARVVATSGGSPLFDIMNASPANELWRTMHEGWPGQSVFLPLDDPMFLQSGIPVNYEGEIFVTPLKKAYDAMLLFPVAHRIPL
jgi:hypothetical protein